MTASPTPPNHFGSASAAATSPFRLTSARSIIGFVLGLVVGAAGTHFVFDKPAPAPENLAAGPLTATQERLSQLDEPLEIRFYSVLDPATTPASLKSFADRVDQLLSRYEREATGRIIVQRISSVSSLGGKTASADGIVPFNMEKGEACFFGLALASQGRREALGRLAPEWEPALECDLARAVLRLIEAAPPGESAAAAGPIDAAALEEVKRKIPNLNEVSATEARQMLRESALQDFKAAAQAMENQVKAAQQQLAQAQQSGSPAEREAAWRRLQQLQAEQTEQLKKIAASSDAQLRALESLKPRVN